MRDSQQTAVVAGVRHAVKIAKELSEEERMVSGAAGAGALGAGALAARPAKERILGRTTLYHGTTPEMAATIRKKGLKPAVQTGAKGVTEMVVGKDVASKPLVYLHPSKGQAKFYQEQAKAIAEGGEGGFARFRQELMQDPTRLIGRGTKGVVRADVPHEVLKKRLRANPEVAGGLVESIGKGIDPVSYYDLAHRTKTVKGGVQRKYIVGSPTFQKLTLGEVGRYAKTHPGRFTGGLGLAAAGLGAGAYGVKKLHEAATGRKKEKEKAASLRSYGVRALQREIKKGDFEKRLKRMKEREAKKTAADESRFEAAARGAGGPLSLAGMLGGAGLGVAQAIRKRDPRALKNVVGTAGTGWLLGAGAGAASGAIKHKPKLRAV